MEMLQMLLEPAPLDPISPVCSPFVSLFVCLCCVVLYCIVLYCIVLYCIVLFWFATTETNTCYFLPMNHCSQRTRFHFKIIRRSSWSMGFIQSTFQRCFRWYHRMEPNSLRYYLFKDQQNVKLKKRCNTYVETPLFLLSSSLLLLGTEVGSVMNGGI